MPAGAVVAVAMKATRDGSISKHLCEAIAVRPGFGVAGDIHAGRSSDRALSLMRQEWLDEFATDGLAVPAGAMGENVLLRGFEPHALAEGVRLRLGPDAVVEVSGARTPCRELEDVAPGLLRASVRRCGVFARVLAGGVVRAGDRVEVLSAASPPVDAASGSADVAGATRVADGG